MSDPTTYYTPDHSRIELRVCPRETIVGKITLAFLGIFFVVGPTFMFFACRGTFDFGLVIFMALMTVIPLILVASIFVTDDLVTLDHEGLTYRRKGFSTKERFFELSAIKGFEQVRKRSGKNAYETVEIHLKDEPSVEIANVSFISKKNQLVFVEECTEFLKRQKGPVWSSESTGEMADHDPMEVVHLKTDRLFFAEQPFESKWMRDEEAENFTIYKKGKFSLGGLFVALFLCCFWNGIVSVFLLNLFGVIPSKNPVEAGEFWFVFVFLIPFELIGLGFIWGVLCALFAGWSQERWVITKNEIRREKRNLGIKSVKRFDVSRAEKLEIEPDGLYFVSGQSEDEEETLCTIPLETQAEARWLAARFHQMRASW